MEALIAELREKDGFTNGRLRAKDRGPTIFGRAADALERKAKPAGFEPWYGPVVNLNGTDRQTLIEQHAKVAETASALMDALANAYPNGRDYQTSAPDNFPRSQAAATLAIQWADEIRREWQSVAERLATEKG